MEHGRFGLSGIETGGGWLPILPRRASMQKAKPEEPPTLLSHRGLLFLRGLPTECHFSSEIITWFRNPRGICDTFFFFLAQQLSLLHASSLSYIWQGVREESKEIPNCSKFCQAMIPWLAVLILEKGSNPEM